jgi:hypothetical protein
MKLIYRDLLITIMMTCSHTAMATDHYIKFIKTSGDSEYIEIKVGQQRCGAISLEAKKNILTSTDMLERRLFALAERYDEDKQLKRFVGQAEFQETNNRFITEKIFGGDFDHASVYVIRIRLDTYTRPSGSGIVPTAGPQNEPRWNLISSEFVDASKYINIVLQQTNRPCEGSGRPDADYKRLNMNE